ncbi:MAG: twin-arginine translocase TatA/TatE family subunit [Firmicutes bacterium]|nr:twin-arginine translocase TatA/TatE family subunit [Bacillota bacterium]
MGICLICPNFVWQERRRQGQIVGKGINSQDVNLEVSSITKIGFGELVLILVVLLVIFGPSKLPELGKSLGKGIREFRNATRDISKAIQDDSGEIEKV